MGERELLKNALLWPEDHVPEDKRSCPGGCPEGETTRFVSAGEALFTDAMIVEPSGMLPDREALRRPVSATEVRGVSQALRELGVALPLPAVDRARVIGPREIRVPGEIRPARPESVPEFRVPIRPDMFTLAEAMVDLREAPHASARTAGIFANSSVGEIGIIPGTFVPSAVQQDVEKGPRQDKEKEAQERKEKQDQAIDNKIKELEDKIKKAEEDFKARATGKTLKEIEVEQNKFLEEITPLGIEINRLKLIKCILDFPEGWEPETSEEDEYIYACPPPPKGCKLKGVKITVVQVGTGKTLDTDRSTIYVLCFYEGENCPPKKGKAWWKTKPRTPAKEPELTEKEKTAAGSDEGLKSFWEGLKPEQKEVLLKEGLNALKKILGGP